MAILERTHDTIDVSKIACPSKWDIIPIHGSDRATFKYCRRQWGWSAPSKANLVPKASVHGIRIPLWYGTGIHHALERFYDPLLHEDPVLTWLAWFDLQWKGGIVDESMLREFIDREPEKTTLSNGTFGYSVRGLEELLPFADEEEFMGIRDLGRGMMQFYKEYAAREDDFTVIAVEHDFSIPILHPRSKRVLYKKDNRRMPDHWVPSEEENFYGRLMYQGRHGWFKQVHHRGRQDLIIQSSDGRYGIMDHKTTSRLDDDYFRHLELDEQCTTYLWAGEREAQMYNLPYKELDFIIYEALLKAYPKPPTILKNGFPSLNRQTESTTAAMFEEAVRKIGIVGWAENDLKAQSYYAWMLEKGDKRFINRETTWRNKIQRENAGIRIFYEALEMLDPKTKLYPAPKKEYGCLNCVFRNPCIAAESGADFKSMLEDGYIPNWDR